MANPHRFYIPDSLQTGSLQKLPASVSHHIKKVLRLREGEDIVLWNGDGTVYEARLSMTAEGVFARVSQSLPAQTPLKPSITLIQALPEGDKMDWIIEKACETGVDRIQPVQARRSVVRLSEDRAAKRFEHWQRVAIAACSQCGRARLPHIDPVASSDRIFAVIASQDAGLHLLLSPDATATTGEAVRVWLAGDGSRRGSISVAIGPEGGWDPTESTRALADGFRPVLLPGHVLRTETAGLFVTAQIRAWADN